jgi:hypothetical protein
VTLTNESFRDPRRLYKLRVKSPFYITGRDKPTEVGEIISLPRSQAAEVIHSNKAIYADEDEVAKPANPSPILRAQPPLMPEPPKHDAKASVKSTKGD